MQSKVKIFCIPPSMVGEAWPAAGEWLLRGLAERNAMGVLETIDRCRDGTFQLWLIGDVQGAEALGACVSEIITMDDGRFVAIYALAGKRAGEWANMLADELVRFAAAEGCKGIRFAGRKGWARVLKGVREVGEIQGHTVFERAAA